MTLKEEYQYRRFSKKAEHMEEGGCLFCKEQYLDAYDKLRCPVIDAVTDARHICNKFERE